MKWVFFLIVMFGVVLLSHSVLSVCTINLDKSDYKEGETATAEISCSVGNEKSQPYVLNWTNISDFRIEADSGTTPSVAGQSFFEDFIIPTGYIVDEGGFLNVNLTGTNLEGTDFASVTGGASGDLIIVEINITTDNFLGKSLGVSGKVQNGSQTNVIGALCRIDIETADGLSVSEAGGFEISQSGGDIDFIVPITERDFEEGVQYEADINCLCDTGVQTGCFEEGGISKISASGDAKKAFLVNDLGDFIIFNKWLNLTGDFQADDIRTAFTFPAIYMLNEFGAKAFMQDNPTHLGQGNISWDVFNQTAHTNTTQNGQAFITAGKPTALCFQVNNSFDNELDIFLRELTFDDDTLEQSFFPLDLQTRETIRGDVNFLHTGLKPSDTDGILEKCTEQFYIPENIIGVNDFDANFEVVVEGEGFTQHLDVESDEFYIYGKRQNTSFVPLIDITNVTTNKQNQTVNACTDIDVIFTYDFYGENESRFFAEYCAENTDTDVLTRCGIKEISVDTGTGNTINDTFKLPYFRQGGNVEVTVGIFETIEAIQSKLKGFGDFEPDNEFRVTQNESQSCRFQDDIVQEQQLQALQDIENKTGTFLLSLKCDPTASQGSSLRCQATTQIELGSVLEKEMKFQCYIQDGNIKHSVTEFRKKVTRDAGYQELSFPVPFSLKDGQQYSVQCLAEAYNLGISNDEPERFTTSFIVSNTGDGKEEFELMGFLPTLTLLLGGLVVGLASVGLFFKGMWGENKR